MQELTLGKIELPAPITRRMNVTQPVSPDQLVLTLTKQEQEVLWQLAESLGLSRERVMVHALQFYQTAMERGLRLPSDSPGCGNLE